MTELCNGEKKNEVSRRKAERYEISFFRHCCVKIDLYIEKKIKNGTISVNADTIRLSNL